MTILRALSLLPLLTAACAGDPSLPPATPIGVEPPAADPGFLADADIPPMRSRRASLAKSAAAPVPQLVHREAIATVQFSPDGTLLFALDGGGMLSLIDARTGVVRASRRIFVQRAYSDVRFDATSSQLFVVSSDMDPAIAIWDLLDDSYTPIEDARVDRLAMDSVRLSPDGQRLTYVLQEEGSLSLRIRSLSSDDPPISVSLDGPVQSVLFSASGERLIVVGINEERAYVLRDGHTGEQVATIEAARQPTDPWLPLFRPAGGALATSDGEGLIAIRHPLTGDRVHTIDTGDPVLSLQWSADGGLLLATTEQRTRLYDGRTGEPRGELTLSGVYSSALGPDGTLYWTGTDQVAHRRDAATGEVHDVPVPSDPAWGTSAIWAVAASPTGDAFALFSGYGLAVLERESAAVRFVSPHGQGEHSVWAVHFRPDGRGLVTSGRAGAELWDGSGARELACPGQARTVAWTANGQPRLFAADRVCNTDGTGPAEVRSVLGHTPDGRLVLGRTDDGFVLHDLDAGRERRLTLPRGETFECWHPGCAALSRDGRIAVLSTEDRIRVFDAATGRPRARIRTAEGIYTIALAPDAQTLLAHTERRLALYTPRGQRRHEMEGSFSVWAFSDDGRFFAVTSGQSVRLVDVRTGTERPIEAGAPVTELSFSDDGATLALGLPDGVQVVATADATERARIEGRPFALSPDGRRVAVCRGGVLRIQELENGDVDSDGGSCAHVAGLEFDPTGQLLAIRGGNSVEVLSFRNRQRIALRTLRVADRSFPFAYDRSGAWTGEPELLPHLRYRRAGHLRSAELVPMDQAPPPSATLVPAFFAPEPPQPSP